MPQWSQPAAGSSQRAPPQHSLAVNTQHSPTTLEEHQPPCHLFIGCWHGVSKPTRWFNRNYRWEGRITTLTFKHWSRLLSTLEWPTKNQEKAQSVVLSKGPHCIAGETEPCSSALLHHAQCMFTPARSPHYLSVKKKKLPKSCYPRGGTACICTHRAEMDANSSHTVHFPTTLSKCCSPSPPCQ